MSRGQDSRTKAERDQNARATPEKQSSRCLRSSRTSTRMTVERARAIQAAADKAGTNQEFKARAMAAAARSDSDE